MTTSPVVTITDELVAELEVAANNATPGQWLAVDYGSYDGNEPHWYVDTSAQKADIFDELNGTMSPNHWDVARGACDMQYIAKANPATILALLSERAELKRSVKRIDSALNEAKYRIEQGRVWNGMGWTLTGLNPHSQQQALDAIDQAMQERQE